MTYNALGWRMAERIQQAQLLPGDALDIAFTLDHNDHPDFGGLELSLRDFKDRRCDSPRHNETRLGQGPATPVAAVASPERRRQTSFDSGLGNPVFIETVYRSAVRHATEISRS